MSAVHLRELTARGSGGVSVLELSGAGAIERIAGHLGPSAPMPGRLSLARLTLFGEELDEILVWCESDQRIELHLHGSPQLVARVRAHLARLGFEDGDAAAGPRSLEQRARDLLPHAPTAAGARMLLDQAEGALRAELQRVAGLSVAERRADLERLCLRARRARRLLAPAHVVLAGPVNSGKSTLFNALVGHQRALVSSTAGTTRDLLFEHVRFGDWPILLFDTAGERALDPGGLAQSVEAQGQELGRRARRSADVVLWLEPADAEAIPAPAGALRLLTRADLASGRLQRAGVAGAVAGGPDPLGAARTLQNVVIQALDLPERAHEPGAGVPFEAWMQAPLERALEHPDTVPLDELTRER